MNPYSRRHFIRNGSLYAPAIITAATTLRAQQKADSGETLKIGLVGCGGRGTGAANQALSADYNTKLVAIADIDPKQVERSIANLKSALPEKDAHRVDVTPERQYMGLEGYKALLASDVDVVLLASPPGFRPHHLAAAVESGKHIFCEKPMAVDAAGYRVAMEAVRKSKEKNLSLVAGFCWRYAPSRQEAFNRLLQGDIGDVLSGTHHYHAGPVKPMPKADTRPEGMSDVEWQVRNWYNFSWLSGDSLVEQAVHSVDKLCWAYGDIPPVSAVGTGGRQIPAEGGNIFDHFHATIEYPGNRFSHITNRQIVNCHGETVDIIFGTKGKLMLGKVGGGNPVIEGDKRWRYREKNEIDMYQSEHNWFFDHIRKGQATNDGDRMMNSTMVGIMARMACYTGKKVTWAQAIESKEDLAPEETLKWGDKFDAGPTPKPGVTALI
jgi:predicted dehydrogenase